MKACIDIGGTKVAVSLNTGAGLDLIAKRSEPTLAVGSLRLAIRSRPAPVLRLTATLVPPMSMQAFRASKELRGGDREIPLKP